MTLEDREYLDALPGQAIDDTVVAFENFPDRVRSQFRDPPTNGGERGQAIAAFQEFGDEARGPIGRILGYYKIFDLLKSFQCLFRPNDFHSRGLFGFSPGS